MRPLTPRGVPDLVQNSTGVGNVPEEWTWDWGSTVSPFQTNLSESALSVTRSPSTVYTFRRAGRDFLNPKDTYKCKTRQTGSDQNEPTPAWWSTPLAFTQTTPNPTLRKLTDPFLRVWVSETGPSQTFGGMGSRVDTSLSTRMLRSSRPVFDSRDDGRSDLGLLTQVDHRCVYRPGVQ